MSAQIAEQRRHDSRTDDAEAQQLQMEREALALLLLAVYTAYPAGADLAM